MIRAQLRRECPYRHGPVNPTMAAHVFYLLAAFNLITFRPILNNNDDKRIDNNKNACHAFSSAHLGTK
jgi:hypothetical protein